LIVHELLARHVILSWPNNNINAVNGNLHMLRIGLCLDACVHLGYIVFNYVLDTIIIYIYIYIYIYTHTHNSYIYHT